MLLPRIRCFVFRKIFYKMHKFNLIHKLDILQLKNPGTVDQDLISPTTEILGLILFGMSHFLVENSVVYFEN